MKYWVIKGNPAHNDWDAMLQPGSTGLWHTGRVPKYWCPYDRVFFWESTPKLRIIALGLILETDCGKDEAGDTLFKVQYLTRRLGSMLAIQELRETPVVEDASFLKSGPATTLYPLTTEQALVIFRLLAARNPSVKSTWSDLDTSVYGEVIIDVDELNNSAMEGSRKLATHFVRERNRKIVEAKKRQMLAKIGKLECQVCGFDFEAVYGDAGRGFCEVHHLNPLSDAGTEVETMLNDLAVLCSNCHRIIHRTNPMLSVKEVRALIR